ncbi:hypothetical protein FE394_11155 [Xenorhabdus sp. Reich]|uniref:Uncharacterized protein n=1 Tax=Xenorhabdus littoralis TaxID=2582835 RepID=A0ABU4SMI0_9GAMM|nr:hypothetical protein [Xenorhabdus sp. Reich]MDX7999750.1 hypothetical protein [Xenorhabdus sp. Reich]
MRNIKVFHGIYTFEDTYRGHLRLSVCAHGDYDEKNAIGYLLVPGEYQNIKKMTPNELYNQLLKEIDINKFRYIRMIICHSAESKKDRSDTPYNVEESFASEFSKLCPNSIVIGYLGAIKVRHNHFDEHTLSYRYHEDTRRNEEVFRTNSIYQLHFGKLSTRREARAIFMTAKEVYSTVETTEPITPLPFLRAKEPGRAIDNSNFDMVGHTSIWFKNGKRIHAEMLVL